jgi:hypothetical protein
VFSLADPTPVSAIPQWRGTIIRPLGAWNTEAA